MSRISLKIWLRRMFGVFFDNRIGSRSNLVAATIFWSTVLSLFFIKRNIYFQLGRRQPTCRSLILTVNGWSLICCGRWQNSYALTCIQQFPSLRSIISGAFGVTRVCDLVFIQNYSWHLLPLGLLIYRRRSLCCFAGVHTTHGNNLRRTLVRWHITIIIIC